ncbi:hypothetical protein A1Q2_05883 [Trichosporon asahii var. asahii CBS 8904]|uniref:Uncharacterized protein n=2 Tax=Trichosporon asahii var. asahii TaxID=189963 RepID=K1V735_TRIAC|nr:hypothetical protein A1Q1_05725 [Trichosporon asahii var. asahii CBS 2479]EJT45812.1 hypothetical protein A1Q1_05725 [Trichosporon asahii var. asahii CBS 2479]EKC99804.1 hypothetical protein A1Q2_05883 [Trichosporon asahii var. asahii CBS 8904]
MRAPAFKVRLQDTPGLKLDPKVVVELKREHKHDELRRSAAPHFNHTPTAYHLSLGPRIGAELFLAQADTYPPPLNLVLRSSESSCFARRKDMKKYGPLRPNTSLDIRYSDAQTPHAPKVGSGYAN